MTIDLDERLAALRPASHWPADERNGVLEQVLAAEPLPNRADVRLLASRPHRRRTITLAAAAGLAAAAAIAVPAVLPAGSPGAADPASAAQALHRLAHIAAVSPGDHLRPDQYWHLISIQHQTPVAGQPRIDSRFEYWTSADGHTWQSRDVRMQPGPDQREVWLLNPGNDDPSYPSPQYLTTLPTEPGALDAYLRAHTSGSTSSDERVFVAIGDMLRGGMAPPAVRSGAIEVLARLGHVSLGDTTRDSRGRRVQEFDFVDPENRPDETQALLFDTHTAEITEERDYMHGTVHFRSEVARYEVVDSVPADIRDQAVPTD